MRKNYLVLPLLALSLGVLACGEDDGAPVARVDVTPRQLRLGFPEVQTLQLTWTPTAELPGLSSQPMVFVHLLDDKKKLVRTFDHPFPQTGEENRRHQIGRRPRISAVTVLPQPVIER